MATLFYSRMDFLTMVVSMMVCISVGSFPGMIVSAAGIYSSLELPPLSPPAILFPIVWILIYASIGIVLWKMHREGAESQFYILFGIQMVTNIIWVPIFFLIGDMFLAAADIIVLWISVFAMLRYVDDFGDRLVFYLLATYLLWLTYALYLNIGVILLN